MPDENGAQATIKPEAVLVIALLPGGQININHPPNEMLCRFMLDKARAVIDDVFRPKPDFPRVGLAGPDVLRRLPGGPS